jgi:hypothetical protein
MVRSQTNPWITYCDSSLPSQTAWLFSVTMQNFRNAFLTALCKLTNRSTVSSDTNTSIQSLKKHSTHQSAITYVWAFCHTTDINKIVYFCPKRPEHILVHICWCTLGSRLRGYHPVTPRPIAAGPLCSAFYFRPSFPEALHVMRLERPYWWRTELGREMPVQFGLRFRLPRKLQRSAFVKSLCTYKDVGSDAHDRLYWPEPV